MILKLAFKHIFSKPFLSIFTLMACAGALTLLGAFWTLVENLERVKVKQTAVANLESLPGLTLFVDSKVSEGEMNNLKRKLADDKRFSSVDVVTSSEALRGLEQQFGETLSKAFSNDSLPITIKLQYSSNTLNKEELTSLQNEMRGLPNVLDVDDGLSVVPTERVSLSQRIFSWASALLVIVFSVVALMVSHLIRIAFESLRPEVETLKVLGASKFWIFKPLVLEGLFFGLAGAVLSIGLLALSVELVLPKFSSLLLPRGIELVALSGRATGGLIALSMGASLLGALFTWPLIQKPATEI